MFFLLLCSSFKRLINSQNCANCVTWEIIYHSKGQHVQLTDRRRKYRYMNYWMLMYFWCRGTLCVWEIRVHCLNEPRSLKSCGVGKFSWKSRSFIILGWSLMTCFSLGWFFLFAKFLPMMIETHWLLIYCLRPRFDIWLQLSLSSHSFFYSAKWWKGRGETNYLG